MKTNRSIGFLLAAFAAVGSLSGLAGCTTTSREATPTQTAVRTSTPVPPNATPTPIPTATHSATRSFTRTNTPLPTGTLTFTSTTTHTRTSTNSATTTFTNTPVPPTSTFTFSFTSTFTDTQTFTDTATPVPTSTFTDTSTPIPPTSTSTDTPVPPTSTDTPVPPTATDTLTPAPGTSTNTPTVVPNTDTPTPVPNTDTPTPAPSTDTPTPVPPTATESETATETITATAIPNTSTQTETQTYTAVPPTATSTPTSGMYVYIVGGANAPSATMTVYPSILYANVPWNGGALTWTTNSVPLSMPMSEGFGGYTSGELQIGWGIDGTYIWKAQDFGPVAANGAVNPVLAATPNVDGWFQRPGYGHDSSHLYVLGGFATNNSPTPTSVAGGTDVVIGTTSGGGVIAWARGTPLPVGLTRHGVAHDATHLYLVGGRPIGGTVATNAVYAAPMNGGNPGPWGSLPALPIATQQLSNSAFWHNGYLYIAGGSTAGGLVSTIYALQVTGGSASGSWVSVGNLPAAIGYSTIFAGNGTFYVVGGATFPAAGVIAAVSSHYHAPIGGGGVLGGWTTGSFPLPVTYPVRVVKP